MSQVTDAEVEAVIRKVNGGKSERRIPRIFVGSVSPPEMPHNRFKASRTAVIAAEEASSPPQTHANGCTGPADSDRDAPKTGFSPNLNDGGGR